MKQHPSSAAARHLRAKLAILRRPSVWGAGLFLLLPLLFLADYWLNPQLPQFSRNRASGDPVGAASAPLGTVQPAVPGAAGSPTQLQDELLRLRSTPSGIGSTAEGNSVAPKPNDRNRQTAPVAVPSTTSGTAGLWAMPAAPAAGEMASNANPSNASAAMSPLQSALDRAAGLTSNDAPRNQSANSASEPVTSNTPPVTQLYNPGTVTSGTVTSGTFPSPSGQTYLPQTSPAPGTTGYTLPPALRTPANTPANRSFYPDNSSGSGSSASMTTLQPTPGTPAAPLQVLPVAPGYPAPTYVAPQSQVQPVQPAPFSVPRTPPGRQIGGGEINTFSNP